MMLRPFTKIAPRTIGSVRNFSHGFYNIDFEHGPIENQMLTGQVIDHSVNVGSLRMFSKVSPPYEITLNNSFRDAWMSAFHSNDRINVSTPFARRLGFQVCYVCDLFTF
jgi:hypothetical protein